MLIEILIFFCIMVGANLWKFLIRGAGEKKVKKHCLKGFPTIVLILEHNIKVFVIVFLFFGGKNDVDILSTFTHAFPKETP